jgi:redox-sensitive bicupin YhaK (pirin superfamily)
VLVCCAVLCCGGDSGKGVFGSSNTPGVESDTMVLGDGTTFTAQNNSDDELHFLLLAGVPIVSVSFISSFLSSHLGPVQ